jgi:hypothetical protein
MRRGNVQAREVWQSYGDFVRSAKPEFGQASRNARVGRDRDRGADR